MNEPARTLQKILDELHTALERAPEIGEESRDALRRASAEIRTALERPGEGDGSLAAQLTAAVERFEVAHPQLTRIVGRVADALSDLGI